MTKQDEKLNFLMKALCDQADASRETGNEEECTKPSKEAFIRQYNQDYGHRCLNCNCLFGGEQMRESVPL